MDRPTPVHLLSAKFEAFSELYGPTVDELKHALKELRWTVENLERRGDEIYLTLYGHNGSRYDGAPGIPERLRALEARMTTREALSAKWEKRFWSIMGALITAMLVAWVTLFFKSAPINKDEVGSIQQRLYHLEQRYRSQSSPPMP